MSSPVAAPTAIVVYGQAKTGKTLDAVASFPQASFVGVPAAFKSCIKVLGWAPETIYQGQNLTDMLNFVRGLEKLPPNKRPPAIGFDDISIAVVASEAIYKQRFGKDGFAILNALQDDVRGILITARGLGIHSIITAHENTPKPEKGQLGVPSVGSYNLSKFLAGVVDAVLRVQPFPLHRGWKQGLVGSASHGNGGYLVGERHGVANGLVPLNLREYLLAANRNGFNYHLPRPQGMEWADEYIDYYAKPLGTGQVDHTTIRQHVAAELQGRGVHPVIGALVLRDIMDRATYYQPTDPYASFD